MGHGASRELEGPQGPLPELDEAIAARLTVALEALDKVDPEYASSREQERVGLLAKAWNGVCADMEEDLRTVNKVLVASHQLSLDIGTDGGGLARKPFVEDLRMKFPKLQFMLSDDGTVTAKSKDTVVASTHVDNVNFDFCLNAVCEWSVLFAQKAAGG